MSVLEHNIFVRPKNAFYSTSRKTTSHVYDHEALTVSEPQWSGEYVAYKTVRYAGRKVELKSKWRPIWVSLELYFQRQDSVNVFS